MTHSLSRRAALGAGLATLMPAPPPALFLATGAAVPMVSAAETVPAISLDAVAAAPEVVARASSEARGDDTPRLPDHAALWARMPLPFSPAEAWHLLSPITQAEIGAAVLGMALADYVSGDMHDEADHFHDDALRGDCMDARDTLLNRISDRLWSLFPDLYGPEGDHPSWALNSGMAPPAA